MESRLSLSESTQQTLYNSGPKSSPPSSINRLWRPAAQRNMKNQWSKLNSIRQEWVSSSSSARSHATSLVNAFLSHRYMKDMELGVLRDMPDIQKKACFKLLKQQVVHRDNLVSSYKEMVGAVVNMDNTSMSLRCFLKAETNSPLIQFSNSSNDTYDNGDGGGIPVFIFWSISSFEISWGTGSDVQIGTKVEGSHLNFFEPQQDRSKEDSIIKRLCWTDEIYQGEFDDLSRCNLDCREPSESSPSKLDNSQLDPDVLQIYLTAWLTDVNIDKQRVEDIFSEVGEEMHFNFVS